MVRVYTTTVRPARSARTARRLWDWITDRDGAPPRDLSLVVSEGRFRDWMWIGADGDLDELGAGVIGGALPVLYPWDAAAHPRLTHKGEQIETRTVSR